MPDGTFLSKTARCAGERMNAQVLGSDITVGSGAATVAAATKLAIDKRSGTPFLLLLAPNAGYLRLWTSNQNPGLEDISDYGVM